MRTTITINDDLYKLLKMQAAQSKESISALVEGAVKNQLLEDLEDVEDAMKRIGGPTCSFDELVKEFKKEGLLQNL